MPANTHTEKCTECSSDKGEKQKSAFWSSPSVLFRLSLVVCISQKGDKGHDQSIAPKKLGLLKEKIRNR